MKKYEEVFTVLEERAAADPLFAEKYSSPEKSHDGMTDYIDYRVGLMADEMHKEEKSKRICLRIDDEEIIGFAVHYYQESNESIKEEMKNTSLSKDQVVAHVDNLSEAQKEEIMNRAWERIMKAEEDKIVNAQLGTTKTAKPKPTPKPVPDQTQLSLF